MKKIIYLCNISLTGFLVLYVNQIASAQCANQVFNTSGTSVVNGTAITVTSSGTVDILNYCSGVTNPYFIGYSLSLASSGTGSYTFNFSPPVNGVTINFGGTSDTPPHYEEVKLYVNGQHYAMTAVGSANPCEPLAVLTPAGDLAGCSACGVSGWSGTSINGVISTLEVLDTVLSGDPAGTVFSLFICDTASTPVIGLPQQEEPLIYQDASTGSIIIHHLPLSVSVISIYDSSGQLVMKKKVDNQQSAKINISNYSPGLYFVRVVSGSKTVHKKIVIAE